ncbi:MAG: C40 family peptidase [Demequinaceae bacterium]|nr:C40 family peptidase [Demequinaceae bacterium]
MGIRSWRAFARLLALHAILGGAVLVSVGGVRGEDLDLAGDAFAAGGALTGSNYALDDARIEASGAASWDFDSPEISVQSPLKPKSVAKRAVAGSPLPPSVAGSAILQEAAKYVGVPYLYGGTTPAGFDCTGFVQYVYAKFGVSLPRASSSYWVIGTRIAPKDAQPGDLIVSSGHVAIYAGGNLQIDAPREGKTIQFRAIWQTSYVFIRVT